MQRRLGPKCNFAKTNMASALRNRNNRSLFHITICVKINSRFILPVLWCCLLYRGLSGVAADEVLLSVKERDSVTLHTDVKTNQQESIKWYVGDTRIAQITGDLWRICTDVQCNKGTERFRDRLKLDNQTGSLTIMNITNTDSGEYQLVINGKNSKSEKTFNVTVHDVSALKLDEMKEGGNVTLYTDVIKKPKDAMTWYFNDILIAGDQSKICSDDECKERFRDRLEVDHQTGSLTIFNITNTDSGVYKLLINSSRFSIIRNFTFLVASPPSTAGEGTHATDIGRVIIGAVVVVLLLLLLAAVPVVIYYHRKRSKKTKQEGTTVKDNHDEETGVAQRFLPEQNDIEMSDVSGKTTDQTVAIGRSQ